MSNEGACKIPVSFLPSKGINRSDDDSTLDPTTPYTCNNLLIDEKIIKVREGIRHNTYTAAATGDTGIISAIKANYDDGTSEVFVLASGNDTQIRRWDVTSDVSNPEWNGGTNDDGNEQVELPESATLVESENGTFIQYRDNVYYAAKNTTVETSNPVLKIGKNKTVSSYVDLDFDSGSTEPVAGDKLIGADSDAYASVVRVSKTAGVWGDGDAVGTIRLRRKRSTYNNNEILNTLNTDNVAAVKYRDDSDTTAVSIFAAHEAGTPSPDTIKLLDACDTASRWGISGTATSATVIKDVNITHYMMSDGGQKFSIIENSTERIFELTLASTGLSLDMFGTGHYSDGNDYICFYLFRHEKVRLESLYIRAVEAGGAYYEAPVVVTVGDALEGSTYPRSFQGEWNNDRRDYKMFFVKLRKDWFNIGSGTPSWRDITKFQFVMTSKSSNVTSINECALTVNYLHLRGSTPSVLAGGIYVAVCEPSEAWAVTDEYDSKVFYPDYATEGAHCVAIPLNAASGTSNDATLTYAAPGYLDIENWGDGEVLTYRDKLEFTMAAEVTGVFGKSVSASYGLQVTLEFTDGSATPKTAASTFRIWDSKFNDASMVKKKKRALLFFTYSDDTNRVADFTNFGWDDIRSLKVTVATSNRNNNTAVVYIDNIRITRGKYKKYIATFTPGVKDLLAGSDYDNEMLDMFLSEYPLVSGFLETGDFLNHWGKYRTVGTGSFQMPYYEHSELGGGSLASLLVNAGSEQETNVWGQVNAFNSEVEGFRVGLPYPYLSGVEKDLAYYHTWTDILGSTDNYAKIPIADGDEFRCWTWISNVQKLQKIIFRLYINTANNYTALATYWKFSVKDTDDVSYLEYEWDASFLHDKKAADAQVARKLNQTVEDNSLLRLFDNGLDITANGGSIEVPQFFTAIAGAAGVDLGDISSEGINKAAFRLGLNMTTNPDKAESDGLNYVVKWNKKDFAYKAGASGADTPAWDSIIGISMEVVPIIGESVSVAFDNWFVHKVGHLQGTYWYACTYVDEMGQESALSSVSRMAKCDNDDVFINYLPHTWPEGIEALNIYRSGGTIPEWRLVGTVGREGQTSYVDSWEDYNLGRVYTQRGYAPPKSNVMALVANRMFYGDVYDRFDKYRPSRIAISEPFLPGQCTTEMERDLSPNDGSKVTAIIDFMGYPVVFKETSVWTLDGDMFIPNRRDGALNIGCIARDSVAVTDQFVIFLSRVGVAVFNVAQVTTVVGNSVENILRPLAKSALSGAVGFIYDGYYWLFYGTNNEDAVIYHITTGAWMQASFIKTGSTKFRVKCAFIDYLSDSCFVGCSNDQYVFDFLDGDDDNPANGVSGGVAISGSYITGDMDFGYGAQEKQGKCFYIRSKRHTTAASYTITPAIEETTATYSDDGTAGSSFTMARTESASGRNAAMGTNYSTVVHQYQPSQGFIQKLSMVTSGRLSISMLQAIYDILPFRNV